MGELRRLFGHGLGPAAVVVAEPHHADAAAEVDVALSLIVVKTGAFAVVKNDGGARVSVGTVDGVDGLGVFHVRFLHDCMMSCARVLFSALSARRF